MIQVRDFREVEAQPAVEGVTMRVVIGPAEGAPVFNMRVFEVQPGHNTPHHSHWWEHEVFVLAGEGTVKVEGTEKAIGQGTVVFITPDEAHCFTNTGSDTLRFICVIPLSSTP